MPGKGANQAVAAVRCGAEVVMFGKLGGDSFAGELKTFLAGNGIDTSNVVLAPEAPTGTALIVVDDLGQNTIVVVAGANALLLPADVGVACPASGDFLLSQFEVALPTIEAFFSAGRAVGVTTILNPAPASTCPEGLLDLVDVIVVNESELGFFGAEIGPDASRGDIVASLEEMRGGRIQTVIVTLGRRGAIALDGATGIEIPGRVVSAVDTTGGGDCFVGSLAGRLAMGDGLERGLRFANTAASICVQRLGAGPSMPTFGEVQSAMAARI